MKRTLILLIILSLGYATHASHIIGGEMSYKYISRSGDMLTYQVTLKLFRICESGTNIAELPGSVYFAIFSKVDNASYGAPVLAPRTNKEIKYLGQVDPCIVNPPTGCYFQIGTYVQNITVPVSPMGYTVSFQSCCRDNTIENLIDTRDPNNEQNRPGNGATYFTELPGLNGILDNSSPTFTKEEAVLVCANKKFTYDFSATDIDKDQIVYSFCDAYGGGQTTGQSGIPPAAVSPPYGTVPYKSPYSGSSPLGAGATIDPQTGIISGIAPGPGKYVLTVCAYEYRNGQLLGIHRKDFHLNVTTCVKLVVAAMPDKYNDCSGYTITFLNNSTEGKPYEWDFGDGDTMHTNSTDPIQHTYTREGTYNVKLWVDRYSNCGDSATATAYVYPLLRPNINFAGLCSNTTTTFTNNSTTSSATDKINYYRWDFGVETAEDDTSLLKSPQFQYPGPGNYQVVLQLKTERGCERFDTSDLIIYDKPPLATTPDTLLCYLNSIQLHAESVVDGNVVNGTYTWSPSYNISNANTADPTIFPRRDTAYTVTFTDGTGCVNSKRVAIDVRDKLVVTAMPDSVVCTGDEVNLHALADGNYPLTWYDSTNTVIGTGAVVATVPPGPSATYRVRGDLGDCFAEDRVSLKVVDPPVAYAGEDTTICYGEQLTLNASGGTYYQWTPTATLTSPRSASTIARPTDTTAYIVTVTDVLGCPKPISDTVLVSVVPPVPAFAGNDTIAILNRPFPLKATGGVKYVWTPIDGLNNPNIDTPVTTINHDITYTVTVYTEEGCSGTDDIKIRFIAGPDIYVPTGFSPNGDGQNDIFRPLPVGIVQMDFFRVYDRWGKLMYSTTKYLQGWNGYFNGSPAAVGTYVWVVQGKNINNETVLRKGTVTLVR